ncbi:MAG: CRISPR-associated endonuclease Cas3'', partial [Candidatus Binatia bacterium]
MPDDPLYLWAKKAKKDDTDLLAFHPLLCHLLDVGAAAEQLWATCLPESTKAWLARQLGLEVESAGRWAKFLAAAHDLGKASRVFNEQIRHGSAKHGTISTFLLESGLQQTPFNLTRDVAVRLAVVVGGHHGVFPRAADTKQVRYDQNQAGIGRWKVHQRWLLGEITRLLGIAGTPPPNHLMNPGAVWLAGFISVADWIGS